MEKDELLKRAEELCLRSEKKDIVTATAFLSPAEAWSVESRAKRAGAKYFFFGGHESCERKLCFFLPEYMEKEYMDFSEYIKAIKITCPFGAPAHRDYMGALLGMGIERSRLGDIRLTEGGAFVFCLPGVFSHLLSIDKAGRYAVKAEEAALDTLELPPIETVEKSFTVQSPRLDAVVSGMFNISRSLASKQIAAGLVALNYSPCLKPDRELAEGDIISLRGSGKGKICENGGLSRKGRLFINVIIYK